ncbi:MAG: hypothetical protein RLP44_20055 [Aggregatilineales bacterium]
MNQNILEYPIKLSTRLAWCNTFASLSLPRFDEVQSYLDFPLIPSKDVQQLAHDFAVSHMLFMRNPEYAHLFERLEVEPLNYKFLEQLSSSDSYKQRQYAFFQLMDGELKTLSCDPVIYEWVSQTHTYHKYENRQKLLELNKLNNVCIFLLHWATEFWREHAPSPETEPYSDEWSDLFEDRLRVFSYSKPLQFQPFPLPAEHQSQLQTIVLDFEKQKLRLRITIEDMFNTRQTFWDDLALRAYGAKTWILIEGRMRIQLKQWEAIKSTFMEDEFSQIKVWILEHKNPVSYYLTDIPDL